MVNTNEALILGLGGILILGSGVAGTLISRGEKRIENFGKDDDTDKTKTTTQGAGGAGETLDNDEEMAGDPGAGLIPEVITKLNNGGQEDNTGGDGSGGQGARQPDNNDGSGKKVQAKNQFNTLLAKGRGKQTVRSEELGTSFTGSGQDSGFEFRVFNRRAGTDFEGLRQDTFGKPLETASERSNRLATNSKARAPVQNRGESDRVFQARQRDFVNRQNAVRNHDSGTNTGRGRKIPTTNKGGETRATATQGPRVTKGQKEAEEEKARRTLAAICPSCV